MAGDNAVARLFPSNIKDLQDAGGITQFESETSWHHTINGLLIQGGKTEELAVSIATPVPFVVGFPKQVLGVFISSTGIVQNVALDGFEILNDATAKSFYWFAIGV